MSYESACRGVTKAVCVGLFLAATFAPADTGPAREDADEMIEEIVVTARQRAEGLQDVPVTITALTAEDLERYNIRDLTEAAKLVPNMQIHHGGSGNGAHLYLRGVGSSSISAAFDQSVAINVDGVVGNIGRLIHQGYLDAAQIEVLKGPQSLYFGKSATAGVISIITNDPGDDAELDVMVGTEHEHASVYGQVIMSGPLTPTLGARLVIGVRDQQELFENIHPGASKRWRGEESFDSRLTLLWQPNDRFRARFKYGFSTFDSDGHGARTEEICPDGVVQPTTALSGSVIIPSFDDCVLNGNSSISDLLAPLAAGTPSIMNNGIPYVALATTVTALQLDWEAQRHQLTSITSRIDLKNEDFEVYDYSAGIFGGAHQNAYDGLAQEFRLASRYDGGFNFLFGAYYQKVEQGFFAYQYAVNIGLVGPDPLTGNTYDYNKNHFLDTTVGSAYVAGYWDLNERTEITAGIRYTREEKDGYITIPYVHLFLQGVFGAPPFIPGLEFDDTNTSPEIAINYYLTNDISVFAAYKQGFKSGGIDNSALPSASLNPNVNPNFPGFLLYKSEEADGFEVGFKARLLDGAMRLNGTVYAYTYEDLQTQLFDSVAIQFSTQNASELRTRGLEFDITWLTEIEGLAFRAALAITDASYEDDFFNGNGDVNPDPANPGQFLGENLKGQDRERSADVAGNVGITFDTAAFAGWRFRWSVDAHYNSGYNLHAIFDPYEQDSYTLIDAGVTLYSADERYSISLIGRNLSGEIVAYTTGDRPGACAGFTTTGTCNTAATERELDQVVTTGFGRQVMLQARLRF